MNTSGGKAGGRKVCGGGEERKREKKRGRGREGKKEREGEGEISYSLVVKGITTNPSIHVLGSKITLHWTQ